MNWSDFERAAPSLARAAQARLEATRIALLGTIRADGAPRISPIEPYFAGGELMLGAMARSLKARDLHRDPRCVLHSAISDPDAGEPEFKLYGQAVPIETADVPAEAWWRSHPRGAAVVFAFRVESASCVAWALERGEMTVTRWSKRGGLKETTRTYP
jgi:Pyridoxamine 5'-phosphate oxidase